VLQYSVQWDSVLCSLQYCIQCAVVAFPQEVGGISCHCHCITLLPFHCVTVSLCPCACAQEVALSASVVRVVVAGESYAPGRPAAGRRPGGRGEPQLPPSRLKPHPVDFAVVAQSLLSSCY